MFFERVVAGVAGVDDGIPVLPCAWECARARVELAGVLAVACAGLELVGALAVADLMDVPDVDGVSSDERFGTRTSGGRAAALLPGIDCSNCAAADASFALPPALSFVPMRYRPVGPGSPPAPCPELGR